MYFLLSAQYQSKCYFVVCVHGYVALAVFRIPLYFVSEYQCCYEGSGERRYEQATHSGHPLSIISKSKTLFPTTIKSQHCLFTDMTASRVV